VRSFNHDPINIQKKILDGKSHSLGNYYRVRYDIHGSLWGKNSESIISRNKGVFVHELVLSKNYNQIIETNIKVPIFVIFFQIGFISIFAYMITNASLDFNGHIDMRAYIFILCHFLLIVTFAYFNYLGCLSKVKHNIKTSFDSKSV
jgi:hypothetical protein